MLKFQDFVNKLNNTPIEETNINKSVNTETISYIEKELESIDDKKLKRNLVNLTVTLIHIYSKFKKISQLEAADLFIEDILDWVSDSDIESKSTNQQNALITSYSRRMLSYIQKGWI